LFFLWNFNWNWSISYNLTSKKKYSAIKRFRVNVRDFLFIYDFARGLCKVKEFCIKYWIIIAILSILKECFTCLLTCTVNNKLLTNKHAASILYIYISSYFKRLFELLEFSIEKFIFDHSSCVIFIDECVL